MSKSQHNTLCIAEWQSFGIEDIYRALKSCHLKRSEAAQANSAICHLKGEARSISTNDNRDISLPLNMTENTSANVQSHLDISVSTKPQYNNRDSSLHATVPLKNDNKISQNDKSIESQNDKELRDKAQKIFGELQNFANQKGNFDDREGNHIFLTPYRDNRLKARNFVGLIQTKSGFCLEILPKTFRTAKDSEGFAIKNCVCSSQKSTHPLTPSATNLTFGEEEQESSNSTKDEQEKAPPLAGGVGEGYGAIQNGVDCHADKPNDSSKSQECQVCQAKQILLDMLRTLRSSPFKQSHISSLKIHRFPLLEVFAIMFLDEVERLIKRGIKSDYVVREENRTFLKGKLLFGENLKYNFAHKERFFSASDEFIADIAPNRLIVSTILFLSALGFSPRTSGRISQARFIFADIRPSKSIDKDFALCPSSRHYKDYELLLAWCEIFLRRKSFMPYQGGDKAFALLFDMNKLFESFVAWHLKRVCGNERVIKAQESHKYLLQIGGVSKFQIKPDIVCRKSDSGGDNVVFIADTKWKILESSESNNYGISQGDLYQMFAYLAKYECENGFLIYPQIEGIGAGEIEGTKALRDFKNFTHFTYKAKSNLPSQNPHKLKILLFNLHNPSKSANEILTQINTKTYDL